MCQDKTASLVLKIPADLSHTGSEFWKFVEVDACIADLIYALQVNGIDMRGSCCGHGKADGHIDLQDGRVLVIKSDGQKYLAEL